MNDFREILKELVDSTGMSLRSLAKVSDVSAVQYSRYLNGGIPKLAIVIKIAKYFNCSLDYLFGLSNNKLNSKYTSYEYDISEFERNYKKLLKLNKITHKDFAKQNDFHESIIQHWRNGQIPNMDKIYTIADQLGGSIDILIGRK